MLCRIWTPTAQSTASKCQFSWYSPYCALSMCLFGQPQVPYSYNYKHCTSLLSPIEIRLVAMSPSRSFDIQISSPMPNSIQEPGELPVSGAILAGALCHAYIHMAGHRCSNPWQWRDQYLWSRNLTFPDTKGFKSLSLISPAIELQGRALHHSGCTTMSSRLSEARRRTERQQPGPTLRKAGKVSTYVNKPCWRREQR